jgi:hypothetical protein
MFSDKSPYSGDLNTLNYIISIYRSYMYNIKHIQYIKYICKYTNLDTLASTILKRSWIIFIDKLYFIM